MTQAAKDEKEQHEADAAATAAAAVLAEELAEEKMAELAEAAAVKEAESARLQEESKKAIADAEAKAEAVTQAAKDKEERLEAEAAAEEEAAQAAKVQWVQEGKGDDGESSGDAIQRVKVKLAEFAKVMRVLDPDFAHKDKAVRFTSAGAENQSEYDIAEINWSSMGASQLPTDIRRFTPYLIKLDLKRLDKLAGDIGDLRLPDCCKQLILSDCKKVTGDITTMYLPRGMEVVNLGNCKLVTGDIAKLDMIPSMRELILHDTLVSGDIGTLPGRGAGLEVLDLSDCPGITGTVAAWAAGGEWAAAGGRTLKMKVGGKTKVARCVYKKAGMMSKTCGKCGLHKHAQKKGPEVLEHDEFWNLLLSRSEEVHMFAHWLNHHGGKM